MSTTRWNRVPAPGRASRYVLLGLILATATGCVPYFYDGKAALLDESPGLEVVQKERSWGDCYFKLRRLPTVYQLEAQRYTITITHGERYWPEFFLEVLSSEGLGLELSGEYVERIENLPIGDLTDTRSLREARRTNPTHKTARLNRMPGNVLNIEISDDSGEVIGQHALQFTLKDADCFTWDAI